MSDYCLLTGATGLVGHYLLRDLLLRGDSIAVLVRGRDGQSPASRIEQILCAWERKLEQKLPRRVHCIEGDITLPDLGLRESDLHWIAGHCSRVLHNAASLTFVGKDRGTDPWLSNLTGTERVLDLCRTTGIRELHYVSTAYVCGRREGLIREEELDCGQAFRNDYEACKFAAEKCVRQADFLDRATVYRPAIIAGDSETGYTTSYNGVYTYLQYPAIVIPYLEVDKAGHPVAPVRFNLTGDEIRNIVPVDWVSAAIAQLVHSPPAHGRTYHLAPVVPTTARGIERAMRTFYNYRGPEFAGPDALAAGDLNYLEQGFYEHVGTYAPYWSQEPRFDRRNVEAELANLPCPPIDDAYLLRLLDFATKDKWGRRVRKRKASANASS